MWTPRTVRTNWSKTEIKLKWNWNETETKQCQNCFVSSKTAVKRFSCFSQSQTVIRCLCKTAVYDAVNQTLINKRASYALLVSVKVTSDWRSYFRRYSRSYYRKYRVIASAQRNETETKQLQNTFETVLFQLKQFVSAKTKRSGRKTF